MLPLARRGFRQVWFAWLVGRRDGGGGFSSRDSLLSMQAEALSSSCSRWLRWKSLGPGVPCGGHWRNGESGFVRLADPMFPLLAHLFASFVAGVSYSLIA